MEEEEEEEEEEGKGTEEDERWIAEAGTFSVIIEHDSAANGYAVTLGAWHRFLTSQLP